MKATFIDALKVPAIISTLRKIQHDAGDSLRVLHGYDLRSRGLAQLPKLTTAESIALDEVSRITTEQTITAMILFAFAHQSFLYGGVLAGQAAQAFISVNSMAAPKRQIINPGEFLMGKAKKLGNVQPPRLPGPSRMVAARAIGRIAEWSGYHSLEGTATTQTVATRVIHGNSLFSFKPLGWYASPSFSFRGVS